MQRPIVLPPINITASSMPNMGGHPVPNGPPLTTPLLKAMAAAQRERAYLKGDWHLIINNLLIDSERNTPHLNGALKEDLATAHHADQLMCRSLQAMAEQAWRQALKEAKSRNYSIDPSESELSGGVFSPLKALSHAVSGKGTTLEVKIENTGIRPNPSSVPALRTLIENAQTGSSRIHLERVSYDTGIDSKITAAYLGHITLRISGDVHKHDQHHFTFTGEARAYHDRYDANASSHRHWFAEKATTMLDKIMQSEGAKDYEIAITGSMPISYSE
jgi:hypothetical protein